MMFLRSTTCVAAISMLSLTATSAWLSTPLSSSSGRLTSTSVFSSVAEEASVKVGGAVTLNKEYQAAYDAASEKLTAALGENSPLFKPLAHFVKEYVGASQAAFEIEGEANEIHAPEAAAGRILQGIMYGQKYGMPNSPDKYDFGVSHVALRGNPETENGNTVDYYEFGCNFFKTCMNLKDSKVLGQENIDKAMKQIAAGENVVFFANHQSEADPQVASAMLEAAGYAEQAAKMVFVAGHKVTTDPLAIPFSMGRNLICIHSKKHIDSDPELKGAKSKQNLQAMNAMLKGFKKGGCLLWVAPSGGRDRRDVEKNTVPIAPFDTKTIDMFRLMGRKSKVPTHYYPMAMVSYELCPPPDYVAAGVGEERNVRFVPVGISVGEQLEGKCEKAEEICAKDYAALKKELNM